MNLRYIERDDKVVLQWQIGCQERGCGVYHTKGHDFEDIPVIKKWQEVKKPHKFWIGTGNAGEKDSPTISAFFKGSKDPRDSGTMYNVGEWFHVVELPAGSKIISYDDLAKAFDKAIWVKHQDNIAFTTMAKELGLDKL